MKINNKITELPWHPERIWRKRQLHQIKKIIIHQEMGESPIADVNTYHITPGPKNHISAKGCPHFCYHFGISSEGEIIQANELSDIVWHCSGQNASSIGIMLQGNFKGPGHELGTSEPAQEQIDATAELVDFLLESLKLTNHDIFGHYHFGKAACPGEKMQEWIEDKRAKAAVPQKGKTIAKTVENLQKILNKLGYTAGKVDGIIGVKTQGAIRKFQADNHLEVDGIVGPQTWNTLIIKNRA